MYIVAIPIPINKKKFDVLLFLLIKRNFIFLQTTFETTFSLK